MTDAVTLEDARWLAKQARSPWRGDARATPARGDNLSGKRVLVVGGGTAGYLSALALRRHTAASVTLVESAAIPPVGVGEATVPSILPFLHGYLDIDIERFYAAVRPTWKLGIRFEWGRPAPYRFLAPFDWAHDGVGALGSLRETGTLDQMSLLAMFMAADKVPLLRLEDGGVASVLPWLGVAYHFDVHRLNAFLHQEARARGVRLLDARVERVELAPSGDVRAVVTDRGREEADVFIDCSGFRALLVGGALGGRFESFAGSLMTDRALVFERPHGGHIRPYTTATTLDHGWLWRIPQAERDHCGYVFSSLFADEAQARAELLKRFGVPEDAPRLLEFRSGRRSASWIRNTIAVGNASGFVEPLESTGLLMITKAISLFTDLLDSGGGEGAASLFNEAVADYWDGLRWFLSLHYKFNAAQDTPFWRHARAETDCSGLAATVDLFRQRAPLRLRTGGELARIRRESSVLFYGLAGIDCVLLGQGVPTSFVQSTEDHERWRRRRDRVQRLLGGALTMAEALDRPDLARAHSGGSDPDTGSR
jgi:tryptophan 7-halogenase